MVLGFIAYEIFDLAIHAVKLGAYGLRGLVDGIHGAYWWIYGSDPPQKKFKGGSSEVAGLELRILELERQVSETQLTGGGKNE